jgi:AcrR family transcriptional regulator
MTAPATKVRGSDAVKAALVDAAAHMLGEVGPRGISIRDVADRAGVNHGQVHHYFGGKRELLKAAMRHLARGHFEHASELAQGSLLPPVLSLADDSEYWRAICQVVMEGDLELARTEIDEDLSVPRRVLRSLEEEYGDDVDELELKARFAALAAQTLGWVAFEEFMLLLADVEPQQREALRAEVKRVMQETIERSLSEVPGANDRSDREERDGSGSRG